MTPGHLQIQPIPRDPVGHSLAWNAMRSLQVRLGIKIRLIPRSGSAKVPGSRTPSSLAYFKVDMLKLSGQSPDVVLRWGIYRALSKFFMLGELASSQILHFSSLFEVPSLSLVLSTSSITKYNSPNTRLGSKEFNQGEKEPALGLPRLMVRVSTSSTLETMQFRGKFKNR